MRFTDGLSRIEKAVQTDLTQEHTNKHGLIKTPRPYFLVFRKPSIDVPKEMQIEEKDFELICKDRVYGLTAIGPCLGLDEPTILMLHNTRVFKELYQNLLDLAHGKV